MFRKAVTWFLLFVVLFTATAANPAFAAPGMGVSELAITGRTLSGRIECGELDGHIGIGFIGYATTTIFLRGQIAAFTGANVRIFSQDIRSNFSETGQGSYSELKWRATGKQKPFFVSSRKADFVLSTQKLGPSRVPGLDPKVMAITDGRRVKIDTLARVIGNVDYATQYRGLEKARFVSQVNCLNHDQFRRPAIGSVTVKNPITDEAAYEIAKWYVFSSPTGTALAWFKKYYIDRLIWWIGIWTGLRSPFNSDDLPRF